MTAILIIAFFLLAFASYTVIRTKRLSSKQETPYGLMPARPASLFSGAGADQEASRNAGDAGVELELQRRSDALLARASEGDLNALTEAHESGIGGLYEEVLDALVAGCGASAEKLGQLASFISAHQELRANPPLAAAVLEAWKQSPDTASTARTLHVAALSDDAATFQRAVETIFRVRREGRLTGVSENELRALFDAEYWTLADDARRSGAGFVLKQKLADVRRSLHTGATTRDARNSPEAT